MSIGKQITEQLRRLADGDRTVLEAGAENSLLVGHRLVPIGPGADPYPADAAWAEPDVEHAGALMRRVFDDPGFAGELGTRAAREIRRTHSPEAAGEVMVRRLESIRAMGRVRPSTDSARSRPAQLILRWILSPKDSCETPTCSERNRESPPIFAAIS